MRVLRTRLVRRQRGTPRRVFRRLVQDRPRDTNLKVAVGREAGLRAFHDIHGTGLSTLDPEIAARTKQRLARPRNRRADANIHEDN